MLLIELSYVVELLTRDRSELTVWLVRMVKYRHVSARATPHTLLVEELQ
ncbi:MAG: hypothetical protein LM590_16800 [Thermofilum sp.]|jgi:hypothetical protein|nr:hypothetical protein [Thermofilum sp.]